MGGILRFADQLVDGFGGEDLFCQGLAPEIAFRSIHH
jgi:hypothetical protein